MPQSSFTGIPGGTSGQVQYNNAGVFGGLNNAQLTADVNLATALLSGAVPAWPNDPTKVFLGNGTYGVYPPLISTSIVTGASTTYTAAQTNVLVQRTNSGSPMSDTLPGTSPGILPANTLLTITNNDTAGILSIKAGTGATLKGILPSTGFIYVCPGQQISFYSDGTNYWPLIQPVRCKFKTNESIFINASTGLSTNDGLTSSTALPDINTAYTFAQAVFDLNITFSVANGTYPAVNLSGLIPGSFANATTNTNVLFVGNASTPTNVVINTSTANNAWSMSDAYGLINGFSLSNSIGHDFQADLSSQVFLENIAFSQTGVHENHIVSAHSSLVYIIGNLSITSNAGCSWIVASFASIETLNLSGTITITLTGTPGWNTAFACTQYPSAIVINTTTTFSGAATGVRYSAGINANINTGGGGANFFPGNAAGVGGGVYQ
jgi:hypothetical protein